MILFKELKKQLMEFTGIRRVPWVIYIEKSELNDWIQNRLPSVPTPMSSENDSPEFNDKFGYETQIINVKDPHDWMTTMKEQIESVMIINISPITGMSLVDSEINTKSKGIFNILGSTLKKWLVQIWKIPGQFWNKSVPYLIWKRFNSMKLMKLFLKRMDQDIFPSVIHKILDSIHLDPIH